AWVLAEEPKASGLSSSDQNVQIETLLKLAESDPAAEAHSDEIAKLMTLDYRGKRLAHWCFYALLKTSKHPEQYLDTFVVSAAFVQDRVAQPGESVRL